MQFSTTFTLTIVLVALFGSKAAMASPAPDEYHKEIGCFAYPATTRTPFCTPQ
jgi:hypothetical protein